MSAADRALALAHVIEGIIATLPVEASVGVPSEVKPVGPYGTFSECVAAQRRRGHDSESARNICGAIERDSSKSVTDRDLRWLRAAIRATERAERAFTSALTRAFLELGDELARIAAAGKEEGDALRVELMLARADLRTWPVRRLRHEYEKHYALVGQMTYESVSERVGVSIGWDLEDRAARAVVAYGGTRAGLVDVTGDTRRALYAALEDGRELGEGPAKLARRIRQYVPAGRYVGLEREREGRGVAYRATMIARTETTYARNVSALAAGTTSGFDRYLVFDARIGPTDAECEALDGAVVSAEEAAELVGSEHPNGTRSVSPVPRT